MKRAIRIGSIAVLATVVAGLGYRAWAAGIPQTGTLVYTGTLLNNGQPDNNSHFILIKFWSNSGGDGGSGVTPACSTIPTGNTQVQNGRFTMPLDPSCTPVIHADPYVQVEVVVDGVSMGKSPLSAVPYSVESDTASNYAPGSQIASLVPPGTVIAYAGVVSGSVNPPQGWLLCDGSTVSRTTYAALFAAIGTTAGAGDGATTFNLPDYRGYFLRGLDNGTGRDPNASTRGAENTGGGTGDSVNTVEPDQFGSHTHGVTDPGHGHGVTDPGHSHGVTDPGHSHVVDPGTCIGTSGGKYGFVDSNNTGSSGCPVNTNAVGTNVSIQARATGISIQGATTGISIQTAGGAESRPKNVAVNYLIKY